MNRFKLQYCRLASDEVMCIMKTPLAVTKQRVILVIVHTTYLQWLQHFDVAFLCFLNLQRHFSLWAI